MVEQHRDFGQKEPLKSPDPMELHGEVLSKIESYGRIYGLIKEGEKLDPSDVFVRSVVGETVLQKVGLPSSFPAIFIADKQQKPLNEDIIAYKDDPSSLPLFLDLKPLFPKGMIIDEIALFHTGRTNPSAFRLLDTGEEIYLGTVSVVEESVLVIKDMGDGSFKILSLTLPRGWKSIFSENGKLIEEKTKQVQEPLAEKKVGQTPEEKLREEVVGKIREAMDNLRKRGMTWIKKGSDLKPQDVYLPHITIDESTAMEAALREAGLPIGLPVILVAGEEKPLLEKKGILYCPGGNIRGNEREITIGLYLGEMFSNLRHGQELMSILLNFRVGDKQGIAKYHHRGGGEAEFNLRKLGSALLVIDTNDERFDVTSLLLPQGWMTVFEKRRLIDGETKSVGNDLTEEARGEIATAIAARAGLTRGPIRRPVERIEIDQKTSHKFSEILEKVRSFPDGVLNSSVKTAAFGERGASVEIRIVDEKITLEFGGLDLDKLKKVCEKGEITPSAFSNCFGKEGCDRLVLEVLSKGDWTVQFKGKIVRWDPGKGCLVDSLPYLGPSFPAERKKELQGFIGELATADFLLSQLSQPKLIPARIHSIRYPLSDYRAQSNSLPMGGHGVSAHYGGDKVRRFYERDPEQIRREKEAYWANKAIKRRIGRGGKKNPSKSKRRK